MYTFRLGKPRRSFRFKYLALFILIVTVAVCMGCQKKALSEKPTANTQYKVEFLFEVDGCKVYRFQDGYTQYFTTCEGSVSVGHHENCGKNCNRTRYNKVETKKVEPKKGASCKVTE